MKLKNLSLHPYESLLTNGMQRKGFLIHVEDLKGKSGWGEAAPLPPWSRETVEETGLQLRQFQKELLNIDWSQDNFEETLKALQLVPSAAFGLESAILSILDPLPAHTVPASALLMGSVSEILLQAEAREREGYTYAKLKVGNLSFKEAEELIHALKGRFRLRIDVNRAWPTQDSIDFFRRFPLGTFDYVEEPFDIETAISRLKHPLDLSLFTHPLAIDESFPDIFDLRKLESLPTLKALIYKPTIQGGITSCVPLCEWAAKRGIQLVLSSCFESEIGILGIVSMAHRLKLSAPIGIGTHAFLNLEVEGVNLPSSTGVSRLNNPICSPSLELSWGEIHIPSQTSPRYPRVVLLQKSSANAHIPTGRAR